MRRGFADTDELPGYYPVNIGFTHGFHLPEKYARLRVRFGVRNRLRSKLPITERHRDWGLWASIRATARILRWRELDILALTRFKHEALKRNKIFQVYLVPLVIDVPFRESLSLSCHVE